jgi:putative ABC transport system substrate-binding protein
MRRRQFLGALGGAMAAWPLAARAQQSAKSHRVAYLSLVADQDAAVVRQRLSELGYSEGKNLIFEVRSAEGDLKRLPQLAAEFVKTNPDVIVAGFGTATAKAAQTATAAIPIIFTGAGDPLGTGIVKSLNRPGANITGLHTQAGEINGKRLQILEDLVPGTWSVAVLINPDAPFTPGALNDLRAAANARGQRLEICPVGTPDQLAASMEAAAKAGATALTLLETPSLLDFRREIAHLAARLRLVAIYGNRDFFVDAGG